LDFGLSEDQEILQQSSREFLAQECPPSLVRQSAQNGTDLPESLYRKIAEMGWTGMCVPESFGGLGLETLDMVILLAEMGRAALPGHFLFSSVLATAALVEGGNARQKKRWLPLLASGQISATVAWLEESDRFDPAGIQARGRRSGSHYVLSGKKLFVPSARSADLLIAPFRTAGRDQAAGITLFLIDRRASSLDMTPLETIDRTRRTFEVDFRAVDVGPEDLLGGVGEAWPILQRLFDLGAVGLAADGLGGSEHVLEMAVEYAKTREQFGRPIASFQAIKHIAAEMVADVEPARSLVWYAGYALDAAPRLATRTASMAKARLSEVYSRTSNRAVQIHGGIGFTWEHNLHFWFKRAKWNELAFGDASFHRERVAEHGKY
jgi:alkylation response protein AidB-like acyl-CoA dehydrogenase